MASVAAIVAPDRRVIQFIVVGVETWKRLSEARVTVSGQVTRLQRPVRDAPTGLVPGNGFHETAHVLRRAQQVIVSCHEL
jgi:hypothetical protein